MPTSDKEFKEAKKAAMRAWKHVKKSFKEEPSTIIICGSDTEEPENVVNEITSWLFQGRQDDGH